MSLNEKIDIYKEKLVIAFSFFGPLGNLIPIFPMLSGFRFYYLVVAVGAVLFFIKRKTVKEINLVLIFIPMIVYSLISSIIYMAYWEGDASADNSFVRFVILLAMFLFTVYVAIGESDEDKINNIIKYYLFGYILSLIAGYIILLGYSFDVISFSILSYIEILPQMAYGFLRFSPG